MFTTIGNHSGKISHAPHTPPTSPHDPFPQGKEVRGEVGNTTGNKIGNRSGNTTGNHAPSVPPYAPSPRKRLPGTGQASRRSAPIGCRAPAAALTASRSRLAYPSRPPAILPAISQATIPANEAPMQQARHLEPDAAQSRTISPLSLPGNAPIACLAATPARFRQDSGKISSNISGSVPAMLPTATIPAARTFPSRG